MSDPNNFNLSNANFSDYRQRINSPRSIEACRRCGVDPNDLFKIDFNTYVSTHPDVRSLPQEFQANRYNNYDKLRSDIIYQCMEERNKIIEGMKMFTSSYSSKGSYDLPNLSQTSGRMQAGDDQMQLEKLKQRQKLEIQSKIDQELRMEMMRKDNEAKVMKKRMMDELKKKQDTIRRNLVQMEEKKKREAYRMFKGEVDNQELQKKIQFKLWQEQRKKEMLSEHQQRKKKWSL